MRLWLRLLLAAAVLAAPAARAADHTAPDAARPAAHGSAAAAAADLPAASAPSLIAAPPTGLAPAAAAPEAAPAAAAATADPAAPRAAFGRRPPAPIPALAPAAAEPSPRIDGSAAASASTADAPLIARAKEEAAKLGVASFEAAPDQALLALRSMRTDGFSIVPAGAIVTPADVERLNHEIDSYEHKRPDFVTTWSLYGNDVPGKWDEHANRVWQPKGGGASREIIGRVTALLRAAMPDENIELRDASMRIGYRDLENPHVDGGGYVTVTITLRGPGTLIYRIRRDGQVVELEAPPAAAAVVTNYGRQLATGLPGTVHSSPTPARYRGYPAGLQRRLLILRYGRAGQEPFTDEQLQALRAANESAVRLAVAYRGRRGR